jgi:REP element-mobilizing transposase RayT
MPYTDLHKGRFSEPGRVYFVTAVTHDRQPYFNDLMCARVLISVMKNLHTAQWVESLSWVVMPDHVHWLFQLGDKPGLCDVMQALKGNSSRRINQMLNRRGHVWQKAYFDRGLRDGDDLRAMARYIVANPLRRGLAEAIGDYPHWDAIWL